MLSSLPTASSPELLVGFSGSDDAGVYRLDEHRALVVTADFITPPVDDPYVFGQIAAANALSDVYAMGGDPLVCLHLACFPTGKLASNVLGRIFEGSVAKVTEAGAVVAGGHTVEDEEPKFGLSVTGMVDPAHIWTNAGSKPGDRLILTKPLGSGVLFNANLKHHVSDAAMTDCITGLVRLNDTAARVFRQYTVHAVTDVSGFGLAGHAFEMAGQSRVTLEIESREVPAFDEALATYERGRITTGSNKNNRAMLGQACDFGDLSPAMQELMLDPQTSGGLLVSLPAADAEKALTDLHENGVHAARIVGNVSDAEDGRLRFV